ncbi:MAG: succinate dehydrogenase [Clostridia bacterium]
MHTKTIPLRPLPPGDGAGRTDPWWMAPLATMLALAVLAGYSVWAALQGKDYFFAPYLSPLYTTSPAWIALWIPIGLRATCYYYRKVYYRGLFWSPPACGVADRGGGYGGEARGWLVLQNVHRYFFYLSLPVLAFIWKDAVAAFRFQGHFGVGLGSILLLANAALLSAYAASCNSCRHVCGGHRKSFHGAPIRHRAWKIVSRLNERHGEYAWASFASVIAADLYIRLLASGVLHDPRLF